MSAQLYLNNRDWPHNNMELWREASKDGKWRWIFWDLDISTKHFYQDNISVYFESESPDNRHFLLNALLKNPTFRTKFIQRFNFHVRNTFSTSSILEAVHKFKEMLEPYVHNHIIRWQYPSLYYEWEENISILKTFAILRPAEVNSILKNLNISPFSIFPNPADNNLFVKLNEDNNMDSNSRISIYSNKGAFIKSIDFNFLHNCTLDINISNLSPGLYLLKINYLDEEHSYSFVKINQ